MPTTTLANNIEQELAKALQGMLELYCDLINCGDAGNWNPEEDNAVIKARESLRNGGYNNQDSSTRLNNCLVHKNGFIDE